MIDNVSYLFNETLPEILSSRTLAKAILYTDFNLDEFDEPISLFNTITNEDNITDADSNKILIDAIKYISEYILYIEQI